MPSLITGKKIQLASAWLDIAQRQPFHEASGLFMQAAKHLSRFGEDKMVGSA
jgi:hypothetical protein